MGMPQRGLKLRDAHARWESIRKVGMVGPDHQRSLLLFPCPRHHLVDAENVEFELLVMNTSPSHYTILKGSACYVLSSLVLVGAACLCVLHACGSNVEEGLSELHALSPSLAHCGRQIIWSNFPTMCLAAATIANGSQIYLQNCGAGYQSDWHFTSDGKIRLATASHYCIEVADTEKGKGSGLELWTCVDKPVNKSDKYYSAQKFEFLRKGEIRWVNSSLVLDVSWHLPNPGQKVQLWSRLKDTSQSFDFGTCTDQCSRQVEFLQHRGICLTTAGWHLREGMRMQLADCAETHQGASQFHWSLRGGALKLAMNHYLCVEAVDGDSSLRLAPCSGLDNQHFLLDGKLYIGSDKKRCLTADGSQPQLQLAESCEQAQVTGCEHVDHSGGIASLPDPGSLACPRQLIWSAYPNLCLATATWHVGNGQSIVVVPCEQDEESDVSGQRQHWIWGTGAAQ